MALPVRFFGQKGAHGPLSNFWYIKGGFEFEGRYYWTSEAAFQAAKFNFPGAPPANAWYMEQFEGALHPHDSKKLGGQSASGPQYIKALVLEGRERGVEFDRRWNERRIDVMRAVLLAKFTQVPECRACLVQTGRRLLVEASPYDSFWGEGKAGNGKNMLGRLLMEVRDELK